jgi:hypothetical protein
MSEQVKVLRPILCVMRKAFDIRNIPQSKELTCLRIVFSTMSDQIRGLEKSGSLSATDLEVR